MLSNMSNIRSSTSSLGCPFDCFFLYPCLHFSLYSHQKKCDHESILHRSPFKKEFPVQLLGLLQDPPQLLSESMVFHDRLQPVTDHSSYEKDLFLPKCVILLTIFNLELPIGLAETLSDLHSRGRSHHPVLSLLSFHTHTRSA